MTKIRMKITHGLKWTETRLKFDQKPDNLSKNWWKMAEILFKKF